MLQKIKFEITFWVSRKGFFQGSVPQNLEEILQRLARCISVTGMYAPLTVNFIDVISKRAVEIKAKRFLRIKEFTVTPRIRTDYTLTRPLGNLFNQMNQEQEADQKRR